MSMITFRTVLKRSRTGQRLKEEDFDKTLSEELLKLTKKYEIEYNPERIIPSDNDLADRVFQAGLEFFLNLGVFCRDTGRIIKFTKEETISALNNAPHSLTFGMGKDERTMVYRDIEDQRDPFCAFTAVGQPVPENLFVKVAQSYAQEPLADTFSGPLIRTLEGEPIKSGDPSEVEAAIWNVLQLREASRRAGRPNIGMHDFISNAESTDAIIAATNPKFGALENDGVLVAATAEMKVDYERLKKVPYLLQSGHNIGSLFGPQLGGMGGGPESLAILLVSYHLLGVTVFQADWHISFPTHIHQACNTTSELLWVTSVYNQALSRNTHLLKMTCAYTAAGPCTEMVVYELIAHSAAATVSGADMDPAAVARNRLPERCSGMEARIAGETGHAVSRSRMNREEVNQLVKKLLPRYEEAIPQAPKGKKFSECYDLDTVTPTYEYVELYDKIKNEVILNA